MIADRTAYDVKQTVVWNSRVSTSIIYLQFRTEVCFWCRKSVADACQLVKACPQQPTLLPKTATICRSDRQTDRRQYDVCSSTIG